MGKRLLTIALGAAVLALASCGPAKPATSSTDSKTSGTTSGSDNSQVSETSSGIQADPLNAPTLVDFANGGSDEIFGSNGWSNGGNFNCVWSDKNLTYSDGQMHLAIKEEKKTADGKEYPYTGSEARTHHHYGPGDYEVRMRPTDVVGSVSSFFTCTGNYDHVDGVSNPWDEVDIEFLGKDTTHVQFNYFVNGVGGHEYLHNLGFDASKEFHNYGFRWNEQSITWFVDGAPVYQVKASANNPLPKTAGRVMTNYWPCSAEGWSGKFTSPGTKTTDYQWIKASGEPMYIDEEKPIEPVTPSSTVDWDKISPVDVTFTTESQGYTVVPSNGSVKIDYTNVGAASYATVNGDIATVGAGKNAVRMSLKNNGSHTSNVRVNMIDPNATGNNNSSNTSATMDGKGVRTDLEWGGSYFDIPSGATADIIVYYTNSNNLQFMIDSARYGEDGTYSGSIVISDIKFATIAETATTKLSFETNDSYTVTPSGEAAESVEVTYANLAGNCYANIGTYVGALGKGNNRFALDIENKGSADVRFRADVGGTEKVGETNCINTNAWADQGHKEGDVYTDSTWGGSFITVAAGEKVRFNITYDTTTDRGEANWLAIFLDSARGDATTYTGDVVLSNFAFDTLDLA
ncbi:MAG: family 16 glycosylhydrolase [Bacilli bacterium]|nr:family 16 glycosylhydrolase [Bacilli bacterium]